MAFLPPPADDRLGPGAGLGLAPARAKGPGKRPAPPVFPPSAARPAFFLIPALLRLSCLFLLILGGCGWLPKINVVSDPLSKEEHLDLALAYERDGELDIAEREYRASLPLPLASLGLGNVLYQKGDAGAAMTRWRRAWRDGGLPAAANNVAWALLLDGGSLEEARELAARAVETSAGLGEDEAVVSNYRGTLSQIDAAIEAARRARQ